MQSCSPRSCPGCWGCRGPSSLLAPQPRGLVPISEKPPPGARGAGWEQARLWLYEHRSSREVRGLSCTPLPPFSPRPVPGSALFWVLLKPDLKQEVCFMLYFSLQDTFFWPKPLWCCSPTGLGDRQVSPRASHRWGAGSIIAAHSRPFTPEAQPLSWEAPHRHFRLRQIP